MSSIAHKDQIRAVRITSAEQLTPRRLEQAAEAGAQAFLEDPVFLWMRPNPSDDNYERHLEYFHDRIRRVALNQGKDHLVLAVRGGEQGDENEEVLGFAIFDRTLSAAEAVQGDFFWGQGIPKPNPPPLVPSQMKEDKAFDNERLDRFMKAWDRATKRINQELRKQASQELRARVDGSEAPREDDAPFSHAKIYLIAVNPKYQRQGVGKLLVDWGVQESDRQGIPHTLAASPMGEGLYRKCGFVDIGFYVDYATKEEDEQYGGLFDTVMVKWPPSSESS